MTYFRSFMLGLLFFNLPVFGQLERKVLPVDSRFQQGTLSNGLKYIIRQNATPPDKVEMYLHIGSGSIDEEDNQQGLAHFLEHMAFNGSKNFPAGTLIKYFESLGLTFGMHQNAFTSFDQTTYILSLPNVKEETLDKGLLCLSDFAYRLDLDTKEIDKERGVIEEEERARSSVRQRILNEIIPVVLPGSRAAKRLPIGKMDVIKTAPRERFVEFYEKWYHPENAVLMIVGDIKPEEIEALVVKHFSAWEQKKEIPKPLPTGIKPYTRESAYVVTDSELTQASIGVSCIKSLRPLKNTDDYRRQVITNLGEWIINKRLGDMLKNGEAVYQSASASSSSFLNVCTYVSASADGKPEDWKHMLEQIIREVKRAREFGFHQQEMDDAMKVFLSSAGRAVTTEATRRSVSIISELNSSISEGNMPMSAEQEQQLLEQILPSITITEINDSFARAFSNENRLILLELPKKVGLEAPSVERLLEVARRAEKEKVTPYKIKKRAKNFLEKDPEPGKIISETYHEATKVTSLKFENGLCCHHKEMNFNKDSVTVRLKFLGGKIEESEANRGITDVAVLPLHQPATSKLSSVDIRNMMVGKNVSVSGGNGQDQVSLVISGSNKDLEEGMRLAHLLIKEAKIEEPIFNNTTQQIRQALEQMKTSVDMQLMDAMGRLVTNADPRFGMLTEEQLAKLNISDSQKWLDRILGQAPIEASIVGDIEKDQAVVLIQKYFGSLPTRQSYGHIEQLREIKIKEEGIDKEIKVRTQTPKSLVMVAYRGPEYKDKKKRRVMSLAARILSSRLHEEIRENNQLTYSAFCRSQSEPAFTNKSLVFAYFTADKEKARRAATLCKQIMQEFAKKGPSEEEVKTAKKQFATTIKSMVEKPAYWSGLLSDLELRGNSLDDVANIEKIYQGYNRDDIHKTVKEYFTVNNNITIVVLPNK